MPKNIFCLIKTCALHLGVDFLSFSPVVNAQCQSNMASIKQIGWLRSYPWKIYSYFNRNESFIHPKIYFAWL